MRTSFISLLPVLVWSADVSSQDRNLTVEGSDDQLAVIHTTSAGTSSSGIDLLRANASDRTDWRIMNDGGTFKILDATNNFSVPGSGTLNVSLSSSGTAILFGGVFDNPMILDYISLNWS